jgi:hypothetical protein
VEALAAASTALLLSRLGNLCFTLLDDVDVILDLDLDLFWVKKM